MAITHQDIIDRMESLGKEHSKAYELERSRIAKEQDSLQTHWRGIYLRSQSPGVDIDAAHRRSTQEQPSAAG